MRLYTVFIFLVVLLLAMSGCADIVPQAPVVIPTPTATPVPTLVPTLAESIDCGAVDGATNMHYRLRRYSDGSFTGFASASGGPGDTGYIAMLDPSYGATVTYLGKTYVFTYSSGTITVTGDVNQGCN